MPRSKTERKIKRPHAGLVDAASEAAQYTQSLEYALFCAARDARGKCKDRNECDSGTNLFEPSCACAKKARSYLPKEKRFTYEH